MTARGTQALKRNVSKKWLTPADVLCVLDDLYTYDAILADAELRHETSCPITRPVTLAARALGAFSIPPDWSKPCGG